MNISDIKIRRISKDDKMKAVVSITFDSEFVVHDIKVIQGQEKLFVAMPSKKMPDGQYKDIAHPINPEMRNEIEQAILKSNNEFLEIYPNE